MTISSLVFETYFSCFTLIMLGSVVVGRFNIRPKIKLQLSRLLLVASVCSPLIMSAISPAKTPLVTIFINNDVETRNFKDSTDSLSKDIKPTKPATELYVPVLDDLQLGLFLFFLIGIILGARRLARDFGAVRAILTKSWNYRVFGKLKINISDRCSIPFSVRTPLTAHIVIPTSMLDDPKSIRIAIAHEGQHHRQGDCAFAYFFEIVNVLFFWNPGMGRWRTVLSELQEFSCDEALVGHQIVSAHDYGRCLFKVAQTSSQNFKPYQRDLACAVGMAQGFGVKGQSILRRRISMLSEYQTAHPKRLFLRSFLAFLSIAVPVCSAYAARGTLSGNTNEGINTSALDARIQGIATKEIAAAVQRHHAKSGSIVVADAKSGRILAFAEKHRDKSGESWATKTFAPASTIKPFVAAAAIDAGITTAEKNYDCRHPYTIGNRKFLNYDDQFTDVSVSDAMTKSVNVCMIKIAQETGYRRLTGVLQSFGFDTANIVNLNSDNEDILLAELALGENLPVTMSTMTKAFSVLANNGYTSDESEVILPATAGSIQKMLTSAVNNGTGRKARIAGHLVAGKTGTVTTATGSSFAFFGGFVPTGDTSLVAFVLIEDGHPINNLQIHGSGGALAAPVFRQVLAESLQAR